MCREAWALFQDFLESRNEFKQCQEPECGVIGEDVAKIVCQFDKCDNTVGRYCEECLDHYFVCQKCNKAVCDDHTGTTVTSADGGQQVVCKKCYNTKKSRCDTDK